MKVLLVWGAARPYHRRIARCKVLTKGRYKGIGNVVARTQLAPAHAKGKVKVGVALTSNDVFTTKKTGTQ